VVGEVGVEDLLDLHVQQNLPRLLLCNEMAECREEEAQCVWSHLVRVLLSRLSLHHGARIWGGEVGEVGRASARKERELRQLLRLKGVVGDVEDEGEDLVNLVAHRHRLLGQPGAEDPDGGADKILLLVAFQVVRLLPQRHGELLEESENGGEAVLECSVQLPSLPLVEKQQPV